ncbi:MAG: arginine--tRNA ligase [Ureaplasma sp.]|nr:arginine--tRNA ligase [Ureaplasma sp.]
MNEIIKERDLAVSKINLKNANYLVEKSKNVSFGDLSSNVALTLSKEFKKSPMEIAKLIVENIDLSKFKSIEISNPGFINFRLSEKYFSSLISKILVQDKKYPIFNKTGLTYNVEWVSANPTGLLHIGHARNAVNGDVFVSLLEKTGNRVIREYVVNDAGNQMNILASSVLVRYKQLLNIDAELASDSYHGDEIKLVAEALFKKYKNKFINTEIDKETFRITNEKDNLIIRKFARDFLLKQIQEDLAQIGTHIDIYFSELKIHNSGLIPKTIEKLGDNVYEQDGAIWLKTTKFGDDKDRVLIKSDGKPTYFMPDIAYHEIKLNRRPKPVKLIAIWGADHYSYITRMKIALQALGYKAEQLEIACMQMVRLVKNGEEFKMSKRTGQSLTLMDLVNAIGKDASRWFLLSTSISTHLELDVDVATQQDSKNPIYYVEYAHARANTLLNKADKINKKDINTNLLELDIEKEILNELNFYEICIENAAKALEPHKITNYVYNLAKLFHNYYNNVQVLNIENLELKKQRIALVNAVKNIIRNALDLLGIKAYIKM